MPRTHQHSLPQRPAWAAALVCLTLAGCQSNRAVIPPPGVVMNQGDAYYNRPAAGSAAPAAGAPVNLAPGGLPGLPPPPGTTGAVGSQKPRDTYDVATRVAADSQPIRVLDSTSPSGTSLANAPRGMTLNDGTMARGWQTGGALPSSIAANPFSQLRGGATSSTSLPQGFSGQDGQWRSRSSYEATERR